MGASPSPFGTAPCGRRASLYTLQNDRLRVRITEFGGRLVSIEAPDAEGRTDHVLLGFDSVEAYAAAGGSFGALLGRTANRIADGRFILDGRTYELSKNENGSTLHGGARGFSKVWWTVDAQDASELALSHISNYGDQGFPGTLTVRAVYRLDGDTLRLEMTAETTAATPVSLSAHPYLNLAGPSAADILDHEITIFADTFLPTDARQIPTGEVRTVKGTPFDFRLPMPAGARIRQSDEQLLFGKGYDHYYVRSGGGASTPLLAARASHVRSRRVLEIWTTQPGLQFYTGNNLNGSVGGRGGAYRQSAGFAFEPQGFPDAPNQPSFPSTVLRPGNRYHETIAYRFTTG